MDYSRVAVKLRNGLWFVTAAICGHSVDYQDVSF